MPTIRLVDITKKFGKGSIAVNHLNLEIKDGDFVSLLGPSGCGKTTTLRVIAGFIIPSSGQLFVDTEEMTKVPVHKRNFGLVFQSYALFPHLSVYENVAFGLKLRKMEKAEMDRKIKEILEVCDLTEYAQRFPKQLSGGQRQRAMIAMVIAQDTDYILLDEPTNNLDIYHASNMMKIVRRLCDELGKTVILVLHEINYAAFYSDYICAFVGGKVARFGTVEDVITKENLSAIYGVNFEIQQVAGRPLSIYY